MFRLLRSLNSEKINFLSLGILALLLFIPLYPKFPTLNVSGTYVAIRLEDFLVAGIILIWFLTQIRLGFPSLRDKIGRLILLYWVVGGLSLLSALLITKNISPHIALLHFLRRVEYMSLFFVALASVKKTENLKSYGLVLLLATLWVTIYGFGQKYFSWPVVSTMNQEFSKGLLLQLTEWARVSSTFAGHYDLAAYLVLILAFFVGFMAGIKSRLAKILIGFIWLLAFYLLILTASRVSFIAYLLATVFVLIGIKRYWAILPVVAFSLTVMLLSADISERFALTFRAIDFSKVSGRINIFQLFRKETGGPSIAQLPTSATPKVGNKGKTGVPGGPQATETPTPLPEQKITSPSAVEVWQPTAETAVEYSSGIRFKVEWPRALRALAKNPLLGTGFSSVTLATDNDYLRLLAETGVLGFLSFWLIFLQLGREVITFVRRSKPGLERGMAIGLVGGAIGLFMNAVFIDVFEASKVAFIFWMLMGILVGIIRLKPVGSEQ